MSEDARPIEAVNVTSNFLDIVAMHRKYGFEAGDVPHLLSMTKRNGEKSDFLFRYDFLREELREFYTAHVAGDLPGAADALIDLVVVAMGTAAMMGLPWEQLWDDVHRANMSKIRGMTGRGVSIDLLKPHGWIPPRTDEILLQATEQAMAKHLR